MSAMAQMTDVQAMTEAPNERASIVDGSGSAAHRSHRLAKGLEEYGNTHIDTTTYGLSTKNAPTH